MSEIQDKIFDRKARYQNRIDKARENGNAEEQAHWKFILDVYTEGCADGYAHGATITAEVTLGS